MEQKFKGILPAIASPCDENDNFLPDKFAELAGSLYDAGVHGLYVCGATSDGYKMRLNERKLAAEIAVPAGIGRKDSFDRTGRMKRPDNVGALDTKLRNGANCLAFR